MENIEQPTTEVNSARLSLEEGSMVGRFKDATSLLNAYNSLHAEFTRKSQKLAELEKRVNAESLSQENDSASQMPEEAKNEVSENNDCLTDSNDEGLSAKLLAFTQEYPDSVNSIDDIKNELLENKELLNVPNGINIAYRLVKEKNKYEPADLVNNAQFIKEYILPNNQVTTLVIDEYIKSLAQGNVPKLISGESKAMVFSPNDKAPQTLADANKIFSKMLEK